MAKNHCNKHYRYVANCPDCRRANESENKPSSAEDDRRLYQDVNMDEFEEERSSTQSRPEPQIPHDEPKRPKRFQYVASGSRNTKRIGIIITLVVVLIGLVIAFYIFPVWYAKISLQNQLYRLKSNIDFWKIYTMNFWSTRFFFNKVGLIGAIIGCIIFSLPPETTIVSLIGMRFGWGRLSNKKALLWTWTVGFVLFYIIGQIIDNGYFPLVMYSIELGHLEFTFMDLFNAMQVFTDPSQVVMKGAYLYSNVVYPIIGYIFGLLIVRSIISIINYAILDRNLFKIVCNGCYIIADIFGISYFSYPKNPIDGLTQIQSLSVLLGFIGFYVIGIIMQLMSKRRSKQGFFNIDVQSRRRMVTMTFTVIVILLLPLLFSLPTAISIDNDYGTWNSSRWGVKIQREVEWTRAAVGLNSFEERTIENYTNSVISPDIDLIHSIRQYDKESAGKKMSNQIGTYFESLADSDIIYVSEGPMHGEYWVAPKTLDVGQIATTAVRRHTEIYDHVEGFLALDTYTGDLVGGDDYLNTFGVNPDTPIFFGEEIDSAFVSTGSGDLFGTALDLKAFEDDILLYTDWSENISFAYHYEGLPDGNLTGLNAFWFTLNMGLTNDAFQAGSKSYLINRNIKTRVTSVLLPGMTIDKDPYLVFDPVNEKLYYAVSIYANIELGSYSRGPICRFLGVVLVDTMTGYLSWIRNPKLETISDPLYPIWKIFAQYYDWEDLNSAEFAFLKTQLRYPEDLWATQISYDFIYHVQDPLMWYGGNDFYELPDASTQIYYIETDLGEGLEFVAVQIVEYVGENALTLAGLYLVRHGDHFGETLFFKVAKQQTIRFIGPSTASQEYQSQATSELTLISNKRYGNILLYPLAGGLYYFIPTYSAPSGTERLQHAGLVNAFTKKVGYGESALDAYMHLNITGGEEEPIQNLSLSLDADSEITYDPNKWGLIEATVQSLELNDTLPARNLTMQLVVYGTNASVKLFNQPIIPSSWTSEFGMSYNYTIASNFLLNSGQGFIYPIRITHDPESAAEILYYRVELLENGIVIERSSLNTLRINNALVPG